MKKLGTPTEKGGKRVTSGVNYTVGRATFTKISEVEGISLSGTMRQRIAKFDSEGASAAERRRVIIQAYRKA